MSFENDAFLRACRGERPDRTPVWIMRQAGRYLPEYRELRSRVSFQQLCRTPKLCAEAVMQPLRRFDLDAAILFSDILTVLDVFGVEVEFAPGPSIATPVRTGADVARLKTVPVESAVGYVFEAVQACKEAIDGKVPLIGFCGAPFTTASYLIEGSGSKDFMHTKSLMYREPAAFGALMSDMTSVLAAYLARQVAAGADALQIFDSWAGALAPDDYREHVLPHLQRLTAEAHALGVPVIVFARGNANLLVDIAALEADVLGIDWGIDLSHAISVVGRDRVVQGNLDPLALFAPWDVLEGKVRGIVEAGAEAKSHVFNLGHGIMPSADPAVVKRLVNLVHQVPVPAK